MSYKEKVIFEWSRLKRELQALGAAFHNNLDEQQRQDWFDHFAGFQRRLNIQFKDLVVSYFAEQRPRKSFVSPENRCFQLGQPPACVGLLTRQEREQLNALNRTCLYDLPQFQVIQESAAKFDCLPDAPFNCAKAPLSPLKGLELEPLGER